MQVTHTPWQTVQQTVQWTDCFQIATKLQNTAQQHTKYSSIVVIKKKKNPRSVCLETRAHSADTTATLLQKFLKVFQWYDMPLKQ